MTAEQHKELFEEREFLRQYLQLKLLSKEEVLAQLILYGYKQTVAEKWIEKWISNF